MIKCPRYPELHIPSLQHKCNPPHLLPKPSHCFALFVEAWDALFLQGFACSVKLIRIYWKIIIGEIEKSSLGWRRANKAWVFEIHLLEDTSQQASSIAYFLCPSLNLPFFQEQTRIFSYRFSANTPFWVIKLAHRGNLSSGFETKWFRKRTYRSCR